ncbi:hypothetical protein [Tuberibacillus calidus]|uniref:hypothetical protein n=1 Tax=Tuberibacillus calidus TaxID=340097 RepID=UPI0012DEB702|nr:hypothetical protein [Tuberibacillus calidus]
MAPGRTGPDLMAPGLTGLGRTGLGRTGLVFLTPAIQVMDLEADPAPTTLMVP